MGLSKAGWQGVFAIEADRHAFLTFEQNFLCKESDWKFSWEYEWVNRSTNNIMEFIIQHRQELANLKGSIDLVAGGPPCQGFSIAGKRSAKDPRNQLFKHYIEFISLIQPKFLLLENVGGIGRRFRKSSSGKTDSLAKPSDIIEKGLEEAGYKIYSDLVYSSDFGVPQYRPRYILFGVRSDLAKNNNDQTPFDLMSVNRKGFLRSKGLKSGDGKYVSVKEAISDLEIKNAQLINDPEWPNFRQLKKIGKSGSMYQRLMRADLNGNQPNSLRLPNHFQKTRDRFQAITEACIEQDRRGISISNNMRKIFGMKKHSLTVLHPSKPSHTLTTLPDDLLHYDESRILTVREMARLQSFPDNFEFHGKYTTGGKLRTQQVPRYSQVGNAVPPLLAEAIGLTLHEIFMQSEGVLPQNRKSRAA